MLLRDPQVTPEPGLSGIAAVVGGKTDVSNFPSTLPKACIQIPNLKTEVRMRIEALQSQLFVIRFNFRFFLRFLGNLARTPKWRPPAVTPFSRVSNI
jgi:hypothetical protein